MSHFNHFEFIAPVYDRLLKPQNVDRISSLLGLPIDGTLLDVGGGTGRSSYQLHNNVTRIIIADSSHGMLSQAVHKNIFDTVQSNSEALPFMDGTIPRIIMVDALHHVMDYRVTLNEIWRILKVEGRIVIEEPNINKLIVKFFAIFEKILLMRSHFISPERIANFFTFPNAKIIRDYDGSTAWITIEKLPKID